MRKLILHKQYSVLGPSALLRTEYGVLNSPPQVHKIPLVYIELIQYLNSFIHFMFLPERIDLHISGNKNTAIM
jgi:hypothetical protein